MTTLDIAKFAKECYPKGTVSTRSASKSCAIYIHFPQFVITNSANLKHTIRDLFVRVIFTHKYDDKYSVSISGMRTTMTQSEKYSVYTQSHLNVGELGKWGTFCLGSAGIAQLKANIVNGINTENSIKGLIIGIERYVKWESTEGGPYRNISSIRSNNSTLSDSQVALMQDYICSRRTFNYKAVVNCGYHLSINISDEDVKEYIAAVIKESKRDFIRYCQNYNIPINSVFGYQGRSAETILRGEVSIARKKYQLKIIPDEKSTKDKQREVNPNLVLWTKRKLVKEAITAATCY
jgi:hypothetical protein